MSGCDDIFRSSYLFPGPSWDVYVPFDTFNYLLPPQMDNPTPESAQPVAQAVDHPAPQTDNPSPESPQPAARAVNRPQQAAQQRQQCKKTARKTTFVCAKCMTPFKSNKSLELHRLRFHGVHYNIKCRDSDCSKLFNNLATANLHYLRSHQPKRHHCKYCHFKTAVKGDLNQHVRRTHPEIDPTFE